MNLVLCGMSGSGKTSVGKRLAELSGRRFVDTDEMIVSRYGAIPEIFATLGEEIFRQYEREAVESLKGEDGLVLSTGGGLVLDEENVAQLKKEGQIVYLRTPVSALNGRLKMSGALEARPLLLSKETLEARISQLLRERVSSYERAADFVVDTDGKTPDEVAQEILKLGGLA